MKQMIRLMLHVVLAIATAFPLIAMAAAGSAVGLWKTIDDETGQAKSLVRIKQNNGILTGKIEKILPPGDPAALCAKCEGALKDKPVVGMTIINSLKPGKDGY